MTDTVCVYTGEALARYAFGESHPFGPLRHDAFVKEFKRQGLDRRTQHGRPVMASDAQLQCFHDRRYIEKVRSVSLHGGGYLDAGDTPAYKGVYEAAATVVGTSLAALQSILDGRCKRAFVPIAGLHHARREAAAGFCVFNDCGTVIETLRSEYDIKRVVYVDIDAHHGDGVFYSFEADPDLMIADIHQDGNTLYPGSGDASETGTDPAIDSKLNLPLPPGAGDEAFMQAWVRAESFLENACPEFILLQCGADSLKGDPITNLCFSEQAHGYAAQRLSLLADRCCGGRLLALGGGGYDLGNIGRAWCAVVSAMCDVHE